MLIFRISSFSGVNFETSGLVLAPLALFVGTFFLRPKLMHITAAGVANHPMYKPTDTYSLKGKSTKKVKIQWLLGDIFVIISIQLINYLEQVLGRTPNWQDRELWFSISNNRWELLTLKYKAQPQEVLVFPFLSLVLGFKICYSFYLFAFVF